MKNFSRPTNLFILLFLLLAVVASRVIIGEDNIANIAFFAFLALLIAFIVFRMILTSRRQRHSRRLMAEAQKIPAKILSVKRTNNNTYVLQLQVGHSGKTYISGVVMTPKDNDDMNSFQAGKNLSVYVNPDDLHDIVVPLPVHERPARQRARSTGIVATIITIAISVGSIGIPILVGLLDTSDREFNDSAIVYDDADKPQIWEVRVKDPDKMFFRIYDPVTNDKLESFKETNDAADDESGDMKLFLCQQDTKVFVISTGSAPLINVYDAVTYEKLSDTKAFETTNTMLNSGIAGIKRLQMNSTMHHEDIIEITSKDGNKCFYNVTKNYFFSNDQEFSKYSHKSDSTLMSKQLSVFVLSKVTGGVEKSQLAMVKSGDIRSLNVMLQLKSYPNLDFEYFNNNKRYSYPFCTMMLLSGSDFYLKSNIVYTDSSIAVLKYSESLAQDAGIMISIVDTSGKKIFTIREDDLPNNDDMKDDYYYVGNDLEQNCFRRQNLFVMMFGKYGAIGVDLATGKQLWEFEP